MPEYIIQGTRNSDTQFQAPVIATDEDQAREQFLNDVDDTDDEFDIDNVELNQ